MWRVIRVDQEGILTGPNAGQTIRVVVDFPWGQEMREFAPTMTVEDIRNTLDSIVRLREEERAGKSAAVPGVNELVNLRSKIK